MVFHDYFKRSESRELTAMIGDFISAFEFSSLAGKKGVPGLDGSGTTAE
jgi:hypothetical protein